MTRRRALPRGVNVRPIASCAMGDAPRASTRAQTPTDGADESPIIMEILDLLAAAIWTDLTGESGSHGQVPWGTEP